MNKLLSIALVFTHILTLGSYLRHYLLLEYEAVEGEFCRIRFSIFDFPTKELVSENRCFSAVVKDKGCNLLRLMLSFDRHAQFKGYRDSFGSSFWNLWRRNPIFLVSIDYSISDLVSYYHQVRLEHDSVLRVKQANRIASFFLQELYEQNNYAFEVQAPVEEDEILIPMKIEFDLENQESVVQLIPPNAWSLDFRISKNICGLSSMKELNRLINERSLL